MNVCNKEPITARSKGKIIFYSLFDVNMAKISTHSSTIIFGKGFDFIFGTELK